MFGKKQEQGELSDDPLCNITKGWLLELCLWLHTFWKAAQAEEEIETFLISGELDDSHALFFDKKTGWEIFFMRPNVLMI